MPRTLARTLSRDILCTVGPASLNARVLTRLQDLGVSLLRINLSHTQLDDLPRVVDFIRAHSSVPICLDSEGAQVRTADFAAGEVTVEEGALLQVCRAAVPGNATRFNLNPPEAFDLLAEGDLLSIDFHSVLAQVLRKGDDHISLRVVHGGAIGSNKAVTVERDIDLPALTAKDRAALAWGRTAGIRHVALSFANRGADVDAVRALVGPDTFVISKIECRNGLVNIDPIAQKSDALLIDRGDLSRQEPIERIPSLQKAIIRRAKWLTRKVYVATNLLESMTTAPRPTRAEVNDVINTLADGADGLVLAAETAIGRHPVACVGMVVKLIDEYERLRRGDVGVGAAYRAAAGTSFLPAPHGGTLVEQLADAPEASAARQLPRWCCDAQALVDARALATGAYSPLRGFLGAADLRSVLQQGRLADGTVWPSPVVLGLAAAEGLPVAGQRIALADAQGEVQATLDVDGVFDAAADAAPAFGRAWPWLAAPRALPGQQRFVAGRVRWLGAARRSPRESRFIFQHKGWQRIVGMGAADAADAAAAALAAVQADGIFVAPAPRGDARAAIVAALCAKNHGCSHFLFDADAAVRAELEAELQRLGDLGIVPLFSADLRAGAAA